MYGLIKNNLLFDDQLINEGKILQARWAVHRHHVLGNLEEDRIRSSSGKKSPNEFPPVPSMSHLQPAREHQLELPEREINYSSWKDNDIGALWSRFTSNLGQNQGGDIKKAEQKNYIWHIPGCERFHLLLSIVLRLHGHLFRRLAITRLRLAIPWLWLAITWLRGSVSEPSPRVTAGARHAEV